MGENSSEFAAFVAEQLRPLGPLSIARFFGGLSVKSGSTLFAMIMDGTLYFAVDDTLRAEYEKFGSQCFSYASKKGRVDVRRFYEVPADFLEDAAQLVAFARRSIVAAEARAESRKRAAPKKKSAKPGGPQTKR
jgi:DNA transformation protein and related proteins